jgi:hypothetical protein
MQEPQPNDTKGNQMKMHKLTGMPRRFFMRNLALGGAGVSLAAAGRALAQDPTSGGMITHGDAAILRFLAAAELIETDLWQQYTELANGNPPFNNALQQIDGDMPAYITENTNDEFSHANFLNAFLVASNQQPVNLDAFRTLPSSRATGAKQIGRLTNLMHLNVDTSWFLRYRSSNNPDFGAKFGQVFTIADRPGIPLRDNYTNNQIQAIADTAAFHFGMIEQGGSSLYDAMSAKATAAISLRIITNIGGTEVAHFTIWNDKAGDVVPVDSGDGLVFTKPPMANVVMPVPCTFIDPSLPLCSVIRPTSPAQVNATGVVNFLTQTGLFQGQNADFFTVLFGLAAAADAAHHQL